jgi:hypothetical protein
VETCEPAPMQSMASRAKATNRSGRARIGLAG